MKIRRFNESTGEGKKSKIAKAIDSGHAKVQLYRLTSHPVLDLSQPGEYYLYVKADIDPSILDKKGKDMFIITVGTSASNIDLDKSEVECAKHDLDSVVVVKDDKKCDVISVEPYKGTDKYLSKTKRELKK